MTSRCTLSLLLLATLLGLSWAGSMEDQFYRSAKAPAPVASNLDESASSSEQQRNDRPGRDSWKKLATDILSYLAIFGTSSSSIEKNLKELSEKVDRELELGNRESYSLHYAKQLLNEQRAVIDALRAGVAVPAVAAAAPAPATTSADTTKKVPSYDEVMQKTEQFVRPSKGSSSVASKDQVTQELSSDHDKLIQALKSLQSLKI